MIVAEYTHTGPAAPDGMTPLAEYSVAAGEPFARRLSTVAGLARPSGVLRMVHPGVGALRLGYETLELPADDAQRLVVYLPADSETSAALGRLQTPRSQALRLVAG